MTSFNVTGKITDPSDIPLSNMLVQLFDSDQSWYEDHNDDLLGMDRTQSDGTFKISFSNSQYRENPLERKPDLYLLIRSSMGKILHKTHVRSEVTPSDQNRLNFEIKLPEKKLKDFDIYEQNISKTISAFSSISEKLELPDDLRGTFLQLLKTLNSWTLYTRENMWKKIGYDGPQVDRYPWRNSHHHTLRWNDG